MKPIIPPVEFISPLSEVEVRMTLRELCGSRWDNLPFNGEVDENSFRFIKNSPVFSRNYPKPILIGDFAEQNGKTKIKISIHTRITDILGIFIWILGAIALGGFGFASMLDEGFVFAVTAAVTITGFGVGILSLPWFLIWLSFQRSASKIKKALGIH